MRTYHTEEEMMKDVKDNTLTVNDSVSFKFNMTKKINLDVWNIVARGIIARDIDANDINACDIIAWHIIARNINVHNITYKTIKYKSLEVSGKITERKA